MKLAKARALWIALFCASAAFASPARIVFGTGMGNGVDDALALAMLRRFKNEGKAEIAAVIVNKGAPEAPVFCALLNEYFGNGSVPVGYIADGKIPRAGTFAGKTAAAKNSDGSPKYPLSERARGGKFPDAVKLARRVPAESEDGGVACISAGFLTNAARPLESPPDEISTLTGAELAGKKIKFFSAMGGNFAAAERAEYNIKEDAKSAQIFAKPRPSKIYFSGCEIGERLRFPQSALVEKTRPGNPVNEEALRRNRKRRKIRQARPPVLGFDERPVRFRTRTIRPLRKRKRFVRQRRPDEIFPVGGREIRISENPRGES